MNIFLSSQFKSDLNKLKKEDKKLLAKLWDLVVDIDNNPTNHLTGIGKPEALKRNMSGYYSRRINQKHRLIYGLNKDNLNLISCYGHYNDK